MLAALARELPFKLVLQPANAGKGAALRRGFQEVSGDLVVIQDADLEYSPEEFPQLIELICQGRADVVYGSRFLGRHRVFLFTHYAGNRLLTLITNVLYNTMLTDMETCYKVMRTDVLRSMTLRSDGFGIEPELTAKIFKRHYRVYEVPITYDGRGYEEGKKITWRDGIVALWVLAILARPTNLWRFELQASMAGLFVLALLLPWSRDFFALNMAEPAITVQAIAIGAGAAALLELGWRIAGWQRDRSGSGEAERDGDERHSSGDTAASASARSSADSNR